jgi:hypothetical protein
MSKLAALANTNAREEERKYFVDELDRNLGLLEFQMRIPDVIIRFINPSMKTFTDLFIIFN